MSTAPDSPEKIAEKVDSGEFFRESLKAYHLTYHDPMTERYFFIGLTAVAVLIFVLSISAIIAIHPLSKDVPFIYTSGDIVEEYPKIKPLGEREESPNMLLKRFLTSNYLSLREEYSVDTVDRNALGVQSQSTKEVFEQYEKQLDPRNPKSPITQFQRNAVRKVSPVSHQLSSAAEGAQRMVINYTEQVVSGADISTRNMRAIITFRFTDITVDQDTGEATPFTFLVTGFETEAAN